MSIEHYTPDLHVRRTPAVRNLVRIWCNARRLDHRDVKRISHVDNTGNGLWLFEVETFDRHANGQMVTLVRDGEVEPSTSLVRFVSARPAWWPDGPDDGGFEDGGGTAA